MKEKRKSLTKLSRKSSSSGNSRRYGVNRPIGFFLITAGLFFIPLFQGCSEKLDTLSVKLGKETFTVEVARTPDQRAKGLMYRKHLPEDRGMLFVFDRDKKLSFWMKNTRIPLSLAYIAHDGTIKEIHHLKPFSESPVDSMYSVRYALEVNEGTFQRLGIGEGYKIELPEGLGSY